MKYIPIRSFEDVSAALNFQKRGLSFEGGCDLYSVKAVNDDKKLYGKIHKSLNEKHQADLRVAASLPQSYAQEFAASANLSRASPFGNLSGSQNVRKFGHLIVVLNATHPDHDFSNVLRPDDFFRIKSLDDAVRQIDSKIYDAHSNSLPSGLKTPGGSDIWNPLMWSAIDEEMDLDNCEIFAYKPEDDPFAGDGEAGPYWDMHYFFVNIRAKHHAKAKAVATGKKGNRRHSKKKDRPTNRVCYLYLRATKNPVSYEWSSVSQDNSPMAVKRRHSLRDSVDFGASKRAKFWLGEQADDVEDYFFHAQGTAEDEDEDYYHPEVIVTTSVGGFGGSAMEPIELD